MRHGCERRKGSRMSPLTSRILHPARVFIFLLVIAGIVAGVVASHAGSALVVTRAVAAPEAIISLGSHEWERLPEAARLARAHPASLVLLTEPPVATVFNCHDCANRVARLQAMGVDDERVRVLPIIGNGTYGEARAARAFVAEQGLHRVMIVTSPYHTRRSLAVFRKVFERSEVDVGVAPVPVAPPIRPGRWWLEGYDRAYVPYEWAATLYYWWKYDVPLSQTP